MKKMNEKKKRKGAVELEWATANFSKFESQYNKLYCDTGLDRQGLGERPGRAAGAQGCARAYSGTPRHGVVGLGHDPTTRPARAMT